MMIKRRAEKSVAELLKQFPVLGIVGPRQVGKTTLAKILSKKLKKQCIYFDLELRTDYDKLRDAEILLKKLMDKCVIIDEVQRMLELFPLLRALVDIERKPARFILLGSASPLFLAQSSETLAGRIAFHELTPFDLTELKKKSLTANLWLRGGFPGALLARGTAQFKSWMDNFFHSYVERDLPMLGIPATAKTAERLWLMLAHLNGSILNYSTIAKALEISVPTVKSYMDFLEHAFLIKLATLNRVLPASGHCSTGLISLNCANTDPSR